MRIHCHNAVLIPSPDSVVNSAQTPNVFHSEKYWHYVTYFTEALCRISLTLWTCNHVFCTSFQNVTHKDPI